MIEDFKFFSGIKNITENVAEDFKFFSGIKNIMDNVAEKRKVTVYRSFLQGKLLIWHSIPSHAIIIGR